MLGCSYFKQISLTQNHTHMETQQVVIYDTGRIYTPSPLALKFRRNEVRERE